MRGFPKSFNQHWTQKNGRMVAKKQFKTIEEVLEYMRKHHINEEIYHPYICKECMMWHIGHYKKETK